MVIFHSYVSLPEGNIRCFLGAKCSHTLLLLLPAHPSYAPPMGEARIGATAAANVQEGPPNHKLAYVRICHPI